MSHKWKFILTNWINCYFNKSSKTEQCVNLDSLLNIISHLRENLNLNESKSSILEADTIEGFICEKYPEFKFENGTVEASNEEEIYIVASLLLFFVCVNSKDVTIKNAMCSRLCPEDQETILKFSKSLMDCSPVSYKDVQAAITEACGQDIAAGEHVTDHGKVAETPPALRSLHSEVRRLQAALDAERFDRNYLQEELARTNLKLEKLLKDKEQHKLDIVNLKAKISMCCGQDAEVLGADAAAESSARLSRQLHDLEERLVATQGQLDDMQYERDVYKAKVDELKTERDKWLAVSQAETTRSGQLADELDTERHHVHSLRELITELRQHNQKNILDGSQLECDDPDASIHSLNNVSVCSEACANVIEVQLAEEKAKIVILNQQIQALQDQLKELNKKSENENATLKVIISEKDNDVLNLKHRINEEIKDKTSLNAHFNDECSKLNNEINELEQKLKDNNESSRLIIEQKMKEIKTLQEEKISLLQSLSDETTKLENIIEGLRTDINTEKNLRLKMKGDYENHIMNLKDKLLNRNNELVELQNNIMEKSDMIEQIHSGLRKEKELRDELTNKYNNDIKQFNEEKVAMKTEVQQKHNEANELQKRLVQTVAVFSELNKEIDDLKALNSEVTEKCRVLEETESSLRIEIHNYETKLEEVYKAMENIKKLFSEEKNKLKQHIDEKNATINSLQMQLYDEIKYKTELEDELIHVKQSKHALTEELSKLNTEISELKAENQEKDRNIYAIDLYLKEEKHASKGLKRDCDKLNEELKKNSAKIAAKDDEIKEIKAKCLSDSKIFEEKLCKKDDVIIVTNEKLTCEIAEKKTLLTKLTTMTDEKHILERDLNLRCEELLQLQENYEKLSQINQKNDLLITNLGQKLEEENVRYVELEKSFDTQTSNLMARLNETEKAYKELNSKSKNVVDEKELQLNTLKMETENLKKYIDDNRKNMELVDSEKKALAQKLAEEISYKNKFEKEYQNQCMMFNNVTSQLNAEIVLKCDEVSAMKKEVEVLMKKFKDKSEELQIMNVNIAIVTEAMRELTYQNSKEIKDLKKKIDELNSLNDNLEDELKKEIANKMQMIHAMQKENEQLLLIIEEDNSKHELLINEKDVMIEKLEEKLKITTIRLDSVRKDHEEKTLGWEKLKIEMREILEAKENQVTKLKKDVSELNKILQHNMKATEKVKKDFKRQIDTFIKNSNESDLRKKEQIISLMKGLAKNEILVTESKRANATLKELLENEKTTKNSLETQKNKLVKEKDKTLSELYLEKSKNKEENKALMIETSLLSQELMKEKSIKQILEQKNQVLLTEKNILEQNLSDMMDIKNKLSKEIECLTQQLAEETSVKLLAEQEKRIINSEKEMLANKLTDEIQIKKVIEHAKNRLLQDQNELIRNTNYLNQQLREEVSAKNILQKQNFELMQALDEEKMIKDELFKEKQFLVVKIESLKRNFLEFETIQDVLMHDKEIVYAEKESLVKSLSKEKAARDIIESEKNLVSDELDIINVKYTSDLNQKLEELKKLSLEFEHLKTDFKKHEAFNIKITSIIGCGLEKILQNIKKEEISNEVLQKLLTDKSEEMPINEKCDLLINVADSLITEICLRKNLEKALEHENLSMNKMREILKQKEMQIQEYYENKLELLKEVETQNTLLDSKHKNIQKLQLENQSLNNELNDVKVQSEIKVHSLKEKLTDHENLTEKLRTTYECQIVNMNVMVTKLTGYLKEKTIELELLVKEKEQLQHVTQANNQVSKSLEAEVKSLKKNQEKIITDFESERLVLKNMITVTESVMEDEKASHNEIMSRYLNENQRLQEENTALQIVVDKLEIKIKDYESTFESVFKELHNIKNEKQDVEKDAENQKEQMFIEIMSLNDEIKIKVSALKSLEVELNDLKNAKEQQDNVVKLQIEEIMKLKEDLNMKVASIESLEANTKQLVNEKQEREIKFNLQKDQMEIKVATLKEELNMKVTYIESLETQFKQLECEIQQEKAEKYIKKQEDNEIATLKEELHMKVALVKTLEAAIKKMKIEYQHQEEDVKIQKEQTENEIEALKEKNNEKEARAETLVTEIKQLKNDKDQLENEFATLKEECKVKVLYVESLTAEIKRLNDQRELQENREKLQKEQMENEIKILKEELNMNITCIESLRTQHKQLENEIDKLKEDLKIKITCVETLGVETEHLKNKSEKYVSEVKLQKEQMEKEITHLKEEMNRKDTHVKTLQVENECLKNEKELQDNEGKSLKEKMENGIAALQEEINTKVSCIETLEARNSDMTNTLKKIENDSATLEEIHSELKIKKDSLESELLSLIDKLTMSLKGATEQNNKFELKLLEKLQADVEIKEKIKVLSNEIICLVNEKNEYLSKTGELELKLETNELNTNDEIVKLKKDNENLTKIIEENKTVMSNLEQLVKHELEENQTIRANTANDKLNLENKCSLLEQYQMIAIKQLEERDKELCSLQETVDSLRSEKETLKLKLNSYEQELIENCTIITKITKEKDAINKELLEEKVIKEKYQRELQLKAATVYDFQQKLLDVNNETDMLQDLRNIGMAENAEERNAAIFSAAIQEKISCYKISAERDQHDHHQVSTPTSDLTHSSMESLKTISDLEKIITDKNRTITCLHSDITYMKSLVAESENNLLDVRKELEVCNETCEQLSSQLKKIVQQKNEEIADLKKLVSKMSVTENRASQIIKVSAKYQAIILKRVAEIKSNTILKELTNFGNSANCDDLKRSLNSGSITMGDLENFLETTDRHLKRCSEKQLNLQKERDRLSEINRINESEIINLKKFLTELSVSFKTFSSVKELYAQKLSRIVSVQRTVRREILNLDGHITDRMMCKLERGYAAVMQDLSECAMNLERWVERSIERSISPEKIKQAFSSGDERSSLATTTFQNASLEVQLAELDNSFQKLLEEVMRAQKGEGAKDQQALTVMEVRAEYEDKLNRMKAKMKQLYQEQIAVFKDNQKEEIATLERELYKAREKLAESSRGYEEHIRALTTELWSVGEKFLMKKDEAEWLRRKQRSGSLMSLQHVHSGGLMPRLEEVSRPSDCHSLRSLPVAPASNREKRERRGLHMSDEEGEVFDNRWLKELSATPRRESAAPPGQRLSELRWRNSLCPPHLKSSYPAETQFAPTLDEEDIKCIGAAAVGGKQQRKEVGITAYKKPGPPTPSKQAGRLSATDSELRESLRVDSEPHSSRKTSTPSRLRSLFRSNRNETVDGTPRSRRLSNIFRKK